MPMVKLILLVFAFVLFLLAGIGITSQNPRFDRTALIAWGLACWVLTLFMP
jgi:hypothetical protein